MRASSDFDYKKYLFLIEKRKYLFVITAIAIMTCAVIASYALPKKYEAKSTVFIEKSIIGDLVKGIAVAPSIEDKIKVLLYAMNSRTLITKVINDLDLNLKKQSDAQLEGMIKSFQMSTDIKLKDKEGLFTISFVNENPQVARDYVNTLVRRYIEETLSSKREESYGATSFLSDQISAFKMKLDKAEDAVNSFKREKDTVFAVDQGVLSKEISEAQQKLDEINIKRIHLESLRNMSKKNSPSQNKLVELQRRLEELRMQYTDNYPEVIKVKNEIESAKEQLKIMNKDISKPVIDLLEMEKIELELRTLKASEDHHRSIIAGNRVLLRQIPVSKSNLDKLEQEKNNQRVLYEQLVARHGQSEVSKQMEVQDKSTTFRIIDPAVLPIKPISPNRVKIILVGIIFGVAGGVGLVVLLDYLDQSVKTVDHLGILGVPILAVIPKMQNPEDVIQQKRRAKLLYGVAGVYFSFILLILTVEATGFSGIESIFDKLHLKQHLWQVKSFFK